MNSLQSQFIPAFAALRAFLYNTFEDNEHDWILVYNTTAIADASGQRFSTEEMWAEISEHTPLIEQDQEILQLQDTTLEHRLKWIDTALKVIRHNQMCYLRDDSMAVIKNGLDFTENRAAHIFGWEKPTSKNNYSLVQRSPGRLISLLNITPRSYTPVVIDEDTEETEDHVELRTVIEWTTWAKRFKPYFTELYPIFTVK